MKDAAGEEEVGADAEEIVDKEVDVDADEELVPALDEVGRADGATGAADEEVGTVDDGSWQGGCNSRPDVPNVRVFCPANFIFFVFGGISSNTDK